MKATLNNVSAGTVILVDGVHRHATAAPSKSGRFTYATAPA